MRGAVAGGSHATVQAGLAALRAGGNAIDAAVAASLMAAVAEPLLTGPYGAGLATVHVGGETRVVDFFTAKPGLGRGAQSDPLIDELTVDFGPTVQRFHVGPGTVAVPGLPSGLWALHERWGRLDMAQLAAPAIAASREGVEVSPVFARVAQMFWPVLSRDPEAAALFGPAGRVLQAGDRFRCPELGLTLARYAQEGPRLFTHGELASRALEALGENTWLTEQDLRAYTVSLHDPLRLAHRGTEVLLPGPPSVAGVLVAAALRDLAVGGALPDALGADEVIRLVAAQRAAETLRADQLNARLFDPLFLANLRSRLQLDGAGFTTHISAVDGEGSAVSITSSLGETAGRLVPGTGVLLNNFLGEADVNPPDGGREPGERLFTMCCPTLLTSGDRVVALGTGGSNRIRSAILHGVIYLVDHALPPTRAVAAPRCHVERGVVHLEAPGRDAGTVATLEARWPDLRRFDTPDLFFGGLHVVSWGLDGFDGAGDPRRCGAYGVV